METLLCIPNFSEGQRDDVIAAIVSAITQDASLTLLDQASDSEHNRTVVTFAGAPQAVVDAAVRSARIARETIDLTSHRGKHPRMGATDVIPLVPLEDVSMQQCIDLAKQLGRRLASELDIPVYLYEEAATTPQRRNLAAVRRGEFEELLEGIKEESRRPDFGPQRLHPTAGATAVGARRPLIAYNVNLHSTDVTIARRIARAVRASSGGLAYVKAMGLALPERGQVQVSMNLTNYMKTPIYRALELIRLEAARYGVTVASTELVGLAPQAALIESAAYYLGLEDFSSDQVLEQRLQQRREESGG